MRSNPPIKGHGLLYEGDTRFSMLLDEPVGGCSCGAKPDGFPDVGVNATKRWHRLHKDELRWRS